MFGLAEIIHNAGLGAKRIGRYRARALARARSHARRPARVVLADGARLRHRRADRHPARRRARDQLVHGLCDREADREGPLALRQRRDRGPGRARGRQQCRRPDRVHPDADARRSGRRDHGDHPRRADHPRHHARPEDHHRGAAAVLGPAGELLDRQPDAAGAEPAPDRAVGAAVDASPTRSCFPASCCSAPSAS